MEDKLGWAGNTKSTAGGLRIGPHGLEGLSTQLEQARTPLFTAIVIHAGKFEQEGLVHPAATSAFFHPTSEPGPNLRAVAPTGTAQAST
jgi:hypothetical protein